MNLQATLENQNTKGNIIFDQSQKESLTPGQQGRKQTSSAMLSNYNT